MHVIIDGNNLLHAMHAHAPVPYVARETMVKLIERWASRGSDDVTLVLDGATPRDGLAQQMTSSRIVVTFSSPQTADDVIARLVRKAPDPGRVRVVSGDTAMRYEARLRRCRHTDAVDFIDELFPRQGRPVPEPDIPESSSEKPEALGPEETDEWLEIFEIQDEDEPFDGYDGMMR